MSIPNIRGGMGLALALTLALLTAPSAHQRAQVIGGVAEGLVGLLEDDAD
jgi:hypothetical protein